MTEKTTIVRETTTEQAAEPRKTVERDYQTGVPHGDEEVGGAVVGAIVAGPAARSDGAASDATAGALDSKAKDDTTVVTREVRRS